MNDVKPVWQSVTLWSLVVAVAAEVAKRYGVTLDAAGLTNDIVSLAGIAGVIYGRVTATAVVTVK